MMITACASKPGPFKLPPRLARQRRIVESKRMETFRDLSAKLKEISRKERQFIADLIKPETEVEILDENDE